MFIMWFYIRNTLFFWSKTKATTLHCSNAPPVVETWPAIECVGFGNSPTKQPLKKVVAGRKLFREILKRNEAMPMGRTQFVAELMDLMKQKKRCESYIDGWFYIWFLYYYFNINFKICNRDWRYWPDAELLRRKPDWNEQLSSICADVKKCAYGTRYDWVFLFWIFEVVFFWIIFNQLAL